MKLKFKFNELGAEIEKLENEEEKSKYDLYALKLINKNGNLVITFRSNPLCLIFRDIGYIDEDGKCRILNDETSVKNYELWRETGMKVCSDKVEWRGKEYKLNEGTCGLYEVNSRSTIYDFKNCNYISGCVDDNIVRFKHNNKPIGF